MTKRFGAVALQLGNKAGNALNRQEQKQHMDYLIDMIDWAVDIFGLHAPMGVKLIVASELVVYGWPSLSLREMHEKYAIEIPGEETQRLIDKAKELNCYISPGSFVERDPESCKHLVFNTMPMIGPEGVVYRYRKVQPWWSHEPAVSPHDLLPAGYDTEKYPLFPVAKTEIGNLGSYICYDALFPEIARSLALSGCEIFCSSTLWMDPYGKPPQDVWMTCNRSRCIENMAYGVYGGPGLEVSRIAPYPASGGTFVCDFEGRVMCESRPPGETATHAILDIDALRDHRKSCRLNNTLGHLRIEAYDYLKTKHCWTSQAQFKDLEDLHFDEADAINQENLARFWSEYYDEKVEFPTWVPPSFKKR